MEQVPTRCGTRSHDDMGFPDVNFNIYETIIIFDHVLNEVTLLHTEINPEQSAPDLDALGEKHVVWTGKGRVGFCAIGLYLFCHTITV